MFYGVLFYDLPFHSLHSPPSFKGEGLKLFGRRPKEREGLSQRIKVGGQNAKGRGPFRKGVEHKGPNSA